MSVFDSLNVSRITDVIRKKEEEKTLKKDSPPATPSSTTTPPALPTANGLSFTAISLTTPNPTPASLTTASLTAIPTPATELVAEEEAETDSAAVWRMRVVSSLIIWRMGAARAAIACSFLVYQG
jgi:hypothetical protein